MLPATLHSTSLQNAIGLSLTQYNTHHVIRHLSTTSCSNRRRVVVTGLGCVSPLGCSVQSTWQQLINSETAVTAITADRWPDIGALNLSSQVCAPVPRGSAAHQFNPSNLLSASLLSQTSPFIHFALVAADEALQDAYYIAETDEQQQRSGVCFGSGIGCVEETASAGRLLNERGKKGLSPFSIPRLLVNLAAGQISIRHKFRALSHAVSTACTTGAHSIGDAYRFILNGDADLIVAGGAEASITPLSMALFNRMRTLSTSFNDRPTEASRPFDALRDGFVMGEGAAAVVLESWEHAQKRGVKAYCEIVGYALSSDAHHITSPPEDGRGAYECMLRALNQSGLQPEGVDYINAHATSTQLGDRAENEGIRRLFGEDSRVSVSSTKGAVGHMLGASGAVESIFAIKAIEQQIIPPTLNLTNIDRSAGFTLDYTPLKARQRKVNTAVTNSFGFGGTNATLIFKAV